MSLPFKSIQGALEVLSRKTKEDKDYFIIRYLERSRYEEFAREMSGRLIKEQSCSVVYVVGDWNHIVPLENDEKQIWVKEWPYLFSPPNYSHYKFDKHKNKVTEARNPVDHLAIVI